MSAHYKYVMMMIVYRLALLSDAASLATQLETKMSEIESWLGDIDAENSMVSIDPDVYTDPEKLRLQRQSVMVKQKCDNYIFFTRGNIGSLYLSVTPKFYTEP